MKIRHLIIGTVLYLAFFAGFMFLNITASIAHASGEILTEWQETYFQISVYGMKVMREPLNFFGDEILMLSGGIQALLIVANSTIVVAIILTIYKQWLNRSDIQQESGV